MDRIDAVVRAVMAAKEEKVAAFCSGDVGRNYRADKALAAAELERAALLKEITG
jgi:hypothetical protein